jgi:hypothetical protein
VGASTSIKSSPTPPALPLPMLDSWTDADAGRGWPTKQTRVLMSSRRAFVRISSGTRIDRDEAGMFTAELSEGGGGR